MNIKYGKSKRIMASEDYATLRGMDFRKARDILTKDGFHEHEYGDKDDNNGYAVYRKGDKEVELQYRWNQGKRKGEAHAGKVTNVYVDDSVNSACGKKSVKANRRSKVMASNSGNASVSKIKKFIEDSVNSLQTSDYTNSRLILDDDLCLYVGYASGFDTKDGYAICAKIAERNDADWADFDYLNMPWNTYSDNDGSTGVFEGDVYDTDIEITPGEDYTQDAQWLADSYVEIRNLLDEGKLTINASYTKKSIKASNEGRSDLIYVIMVNGDPVAKGSYDAMVKKSYTYNYPIQMLKFPKAKLNSLMKMAKDAHRPDPLKFAVNRFINDYTDEYDSLNSSCTKKSVKASVGDSIELTFICPDLETGRLVADKAQEIGGFGSTWNETKWVYIDVPSTQSVDNVDDLIQYAQSVGVFLNRPSAKLLDAWADSKSDLVLRGSTELSIKSNKINKRRAITSARTLDIYTWEELTPEQQAYVVDNWSSMRKLAEVIYDWHSEDIMFGYNDEAQYIADQYASKYGLSINPDKLYWQSNSQGPYPEWNFEQVFDDYEFDGTDGEYYAVEFYGRGLDVQSDVSGAFYDDISAEDQAKVDEITSHAQEYIDEMWSYINDVCQAYPDDEWVEGTMESNPDAFEFIITDSGEVKYY